ncbi:MAG TPA: NUDIX domain-containing protein [Vulgatibacter sp.]|nr:NUDIX domain-containing protein [Vulgatibacter sp.]
MVPYREEDGKILYLVISSAVTKREHWEFPKGGVEEGEREVQTALRELEEETGVSEVRLLPGFREPIRYIYRRPEGLVSKQVVYFIGKVSNPAVTLREVEAKDYRWATYDETYRLIRHSNARVLLERAHAFITGKPRPEGQERRRHPRPPPKAPAPRPSPDRKADAPPAETAPASEPPRRRRRRRRRRGRGGGGAPGQGTPDQRKSEQRATEERMHGQGPPGSAPGQGTSGQGTPPAD